MKKIIILNAIILMASCCFAQQNFTQTSYFIHNEGQIRDQENHPRGDIDFVYRKDGMQLLIGKGKLEYSFINSTGNSATVMQLNQMNTITSGPLAEGGSEYTENYYLNGSIIEGAPSASRIRYRNIYPGIDWVIYLNDGKPEQEFVVHKNADAKNIQWQYKGNAEVAIASNGDLQVRTSDGIITEKAPQSFTQKGHAVSSAYCKKDEVFSYALSNVPNGDYTIDPSLEWSTYLRGDELGLVVYSATADKSGHIYVCGVTNCGKGLASSSGVHQSSLSGLTDAFVSKFDTTGHHIWTTYYGGPGEAISGAGDGFADLAIGASGLYLVGSTGSLTGISSGGTEQDFYYTPSYHVLDGMIVKLDTSGKRIWGRYYGGGGSDYLYSVAIDPLENLYVVGNTTSKDNLVTPGADKVTFGAGASDTSYFDVILAKFDKNGKRKWATYSGGRYSEEGTSVAVNGSNVYITGNTSSVENISTPGAFQTTLKGTPEISRDNFLMRYDTSGKRKWGTYYGGSELEGLSKVTSNSTGQIYLYSTTFSTSDIASPGAWQTTMKGYGDVYLAKFDSTGSKRIWATYIGGADIDGTNYPGGKIVCDDAGDDNNIHVFGYTRSNGLATADAYQDTVYNKTYQDAFFASVNGVGKPYYFTYFGGEGKETPCATVYDGKSLYLAGVTESFSNIATHGSYKSTYKGYGAGFLAKFGPTKTSSLDKDKISLNADIKVYPNPTTNKVNLKGKFSAGISDIAQIQLYNVAGKKVQSAKCQVINGILDYEFVFYQSLQAGVYQLSINLNEWSKTIQILKNGE
ncbi:MAG: SBBP repeat-containing protein [Chitinophagaceae bacterium]|jgi:hypothetical protein